MLKPSCQWPDVPSLWHLLLNYAINNNGSQFLLFLILGEFNQWIFDADTGDNWLLWYTVKVGITLWYLDWLSFLTQCLDHMKHRHEKKKRNNKSFERPRENAKSFLYIARCVWLGSRQLLDLPDGLLHIICSRPVILKCEGYSFAQQ